jgi:hypothetical protein
MVNACIRKDFKYLYSPLKEKGVLLMSLCDINDSEYNESNNALWISGKFTITYTDPKTGKARVVAYNDKLHCFEFPYIFNNIELLMDAINKNKSIIKDKDIPYPVSL